jgi:hypothetical protein
VKQTIAATNKARKIICRIYHSAGRKAIEYRRSG